MKILDTHQHLILPDRFGYSWCGGVPALAGRTFGLPEYQAAAAGTGIDRTLFMETAVDDPDARREAEFALQLAGDPASGVAGVIATAHPETHDFPGELDALLHPRLKGLRRVLHVVPDAVSQTPCFAPNIARLAEHRLTFDLCLLPRQLHLGEDLARRAPNVQFILDHCGVPGIAGGDLDPWREAIRRISKLPNIACKVSGVVAYCRPDDVSASAIRPVVEHCVACFGWDRVLFGGDWPVCNMTSSLGRWVAIVRELMSAESPERQRKFFAGNAARIYRVDG